MMKTLDRPQMKLATLALVIAAALALGGCKSAATKACEKESPGGVARGAAQGSGITACGACCTSHGSYQAANNNVEATCRCN